MSELDRFKRLAKSLIPRFPKGEERQYHLEDARMMINDLGLSLSPEVLNYLVTTDTVLDDFINSIYNVEQKLRKRIVTDFATIDTEWNPKAYMEDGTVAFTIKTRKHEVIFAEYELPKHLRNSSS